MNEAVRLIEAETLLEGDMGILAYQQLQGAGRRGRPWVSSPGNLHLSLVIPFQENICHLGEFSFIAAVALREVIAEILGAESEVLCKWPNDILVNGSKIAGILIEKHERSSDKSCWLIIGIGVNIESCPAESGLLKATCLNSLGARGFKPQTIAEMFYHSFAHWRDLWFKSSFKVIQTEWMKWAAGLGQKVHVKFPDQVNQVEGKFCELDFDGAFVLETTELKRIRIHTADIDILRI
ncbi:MAG: biotin--[acetyl-CoA-carboxylase] ligase [Alphaproteobacteria bacterium]|nr:biotin--[acetyl-CoA-carboxylase] ligase [Alphaproteobacteria bacterium]